MDGWGFFSTPIGPMQPVGRDELGRPTYRNALTGIVYGSDLPDAVTPEEYIARVRGIEAGGNALTQMNRPSAMEQGRNALAALAEGALQGVTAPGRAARGEPVTYGDAWATALDYGAVGNLASAPEGALRGGNIRAYHVSRNNFDRIDPQRGGRGATFFAATPEAARTGANAGQNELARLGANTPDARPLVTYAATIDGSRIRGLDLTPAERAFFDAIPDRLTPAEFEALRAQAPSVEMREYFDRFFDDVPTDPRYSSFGDMPDEVLANIADDDYVLIKRPPPSMTYEDAARSGRNIYGQGWPHYDSGLNEAGVAERVRESGMGGYLVQDEAGLSVAVTDPSIVTGFTPSFRAYHGSPHDFDRFDISRIGTGEGAQAYGHGLYFAESEGVARSYRDALTKRGGLSPRRQEEVMTPIADWLRQNHSDPSIADNIMGSTMFIQGRSFDEAAQIMAQNASRARSHAEKSIYQRHADAFRALADNGVSNPIQGRLYEVQINADPETFLDWNAPLSQQPQVQSRLAADPDIGFLAQEQANNPNPMSGLEYNIGARSDLFDNPRDYQRNAATRLRDAGIPGIRYLDQGSRGAGAGTRNFVVFDDSIIDIIRKYGVAAAAPMLGMTVAQLEAEMQAQGVAE